MREIKFRAWDKKNKAMRNVWGLNWSFSGDKLQSVIAVDPVINGEYILKNDDFELMQFTGLFDATQWGDLSEKEQLGFVTDGKGYTSDDWRGKEIYEGDIVKVNKEVAESISEPKIVSIIWDEKDGAFFTSNHRYLWLVATKAYNNCEVIGNIWENPKLLK